MTKAKIDFTSGPILKKLLIFTLPIIATNLLQVFYNAADMMVVSLSDEPNAVGAVGITGSFINLVTNLFIGFSVGANVVIARHIGAKNDRDAERATHTAVLMALAVGILGGVIGLFLSRPVLVWMGNTGNVLDLATRYTFIYFLGIPFISLTNVLVSILRAKGDSRTPLIILSLSGIVNVLLNLFFVLAVGLSVEGVAIATVIANVLSTVVLAIKLKMSEGPVSLSFSKLRIDRRAFRDIFVIGVPSGIQGAFFSISNMLIQSSIVTVNNLLTPDPNLSPVLNGNAAQMNLDGFIYTSMSAVCQATSTFISQNYGAHDTMRMKKGLFTCYGIVTVTGIAVSAIIMLFRVPLLSLYGVVDGPVGSADAIAFETAYVRMLFLTIPYFLCGIMEVGTYSIRSVGKPITSFLISLFGACIFRIIWTLFIFPLKVDLVTLFVSYPISWALAGLVAFVLSVIFINKLEKRRSATPC
ncbi:MAG: MATE family efflux transporter [Clostridia bacterium]|nr:MATE family efflux transporter [Clostridia bacterium]